MEERATPFKALLDVGSSSIDAISYNACLSACAHKWAYILYLLEEMQLKGLRRDGYSYASGMSGMDSKWPQALLLFEYMGQEFIEQDQAPEELYE